MARRSELKGIANSLNESFVSRNNDVDGYWGLGVLKLFTAQRGMTSIGFILSECDSSCDTDIVKNIQQYYSLMLRDLLKKQKISDAWIRNVSITLEFNSTAEDAQLKNASAFGEPYQCVCQITDDREHRYSSIIYGRCQSHSTEKVLRSTRGKLRSGN